MDPSTPAPLRRSFSLPITPRQPSSPDSQIEVLYTLPSAKIVAFTTSNTTPHAPSSRPSSSSGSPVRDAEPGTLSWVSRFERTIALGMLSHAIQTSHLLIICRRPTYISSSRKCGFLELRQCLEANLTQVASLVC